MSPQPACQPAALPAGSGPVDPLRILVVEDRLFNIEGLWRALGECGYAVCGSVDRLFDAPAAVARLRPDVVLMDGHHSCTRLGQALAEDIRARFGAPVMFISSPGDVPSYDMGH